MENQNFGSKMKRLLRKVVISLILLAILVFSYLYWGSYSKDGVRAGTVVKVSDKGFIFKTYEGQLNVETFGAIKRGSVINETFDFSVEKSDTEVFETLKAVALSGERVSLHYTERYMHFFWRGDTKYFVTGVERSNQ